ncbi:MAG: peptidylprolyl isomerase [Planctomycetota bacterium]
MRRAGSPLAIAASLGVIVFTPGHASSAEPAPLGVDRPYFALERPIDVQVTVPGGNAQNTNLELAVLDAGTARTLAIAPVEPGVAAIGDLFPVLWTLTPPRVLHVQLYADDDAIGSSLILRPLVQPPDDDTDRPTRRRRADDEPTPPPLSGYHVSVDRDLVLRTNMGDLRFRLREDHAPQTTRVFADLAEDGMLDRTPIFRIGHAGVDGPPVLIQGGDPTRTGLGGPGFQIDFEPSTLPHRFGTLSLAREPARHDSGASQFFVCVAQDGCGEFDGDYTAFGELIDGAAVLDAIAATPTVANNPDDPRSPRETPVNDIVIDRAELRPAAPHGEGPPALTPQDIPPINR